MARISAGTGRKNWQVPWKGTRQSNFNLGRTLMIAHTARKIGPLAEELPGVVMTWAAGGLEFGVPQLFHAFLRSNVHTTSGLPNIPGESLRKIRQPVQSNTRDCAKPSSEPDWLKGASPGCSCSGRCSWDRAPGARRCPGQSCACNRGRAGRRAARCTPAPFCHRSSPSRGCPAR